MLNYIVFSVFTKILGMFSIRLKKLLGLEKNEKYKLDKISQL